MASNPLPNPTRIFIDASVLFAAALSDTGFARDLILAGARGELSLVLSAFVIEETRRNLGAKAPRALPFLATFLALDLMQVIDPPAGLVQQVGAHIALKVAPIVAGAVHAEAKFLATYDRRHLLAQAALIRDRFGITVGTPEAVLAIAYATRGRQMVAPGASGAFSFLLPSFFVANEGYVSTLGPLHRFLSADARLAE